MKKPFAIVAGILVAVLAILAASSLFTVHQAEQALVLQFGEPRRVIQKPGLNFKIPFVQNVRYLDFRLLEFDAPAEEMILSDQKRLVVDAFTLYRISNPLKFYQSVGTEAVARTRLGSIVNAATRRTLGSVPLSTVVSKERASIMSDIRDTVNKEAKPLGINVVDVRMKRADLPDENSQAIFRRMQTEREREAKEFRAQGAEVGQRIRSRADKEKTPSCSPKPAKTRRFCGVKAMAKQCASSPRHLAKTLISSLLLPFDAGLPGSVVKRRYDHGSVARKRLFQILRPHRGCAAVRTKVPSPRQV